MSKLIIETEMNGIPDCCGLCDPLFMVVCATEHDQTIDKMMLRVGRPSWCPIKGVLPDEHGDLVDSEEDVSNYITVWDCNCSEFGRQTVMAVEDLHYLPIIVPAERKDYGKTAD